MHVVHVYDGHERVEHGEGSVPTVVWDLATETAAHGWDVTVIERQWEGQARTATRAGVEFRRLALRTGSRQPWEQVPYRMMSNPISIGQLLVDRANFARKALGQLRELDYDVVHVHLPFAANVMATIAPALRERMVYTAHLGETRKRVDDPLVSPDVYLAKRVGVTTVLNPAMRRSFEHRGVPHDALRVIPNGVNIEKSQRYRNAPLDDVRDTYRIGSERIVLFAGTVTPRKGVSELVEAAATIRKTVGPVRFLVVGRTGLSPEYEQEVRARLASNDLEESVTLTGFIPASDLYKLYQLADIFVLPSHEEGFGMVVTEAMAAGTPVVGTEVGGIPQQVTHGEQGLLIPPNDVPALTDAIVELLSNDEKRARLGRAAKLRANDFAWTRIAEQFITVYQHVIES